MTTGIEELKLPPKRKGRGPGKKPALVPTNIRIPKEVLEFYQKFGKAQQSKIREALTDYVLNHTTTEGETNVG